MIRVIMRLEGLPLNNTRTDLEKFDQNRARAVIQPFINDENPDDRQNEKFRSSKTFVILSNSAILPMGIWNEAGGFSVFNAILHIRMLRQ